MKNKIPISVCILSILAYSNQGISSLPSQCLYYLTRENWHLSVTSIGLIGWVLIIPWSIKILWGYFIDYKPIKGYHSKYYLRINYILLLAVYLYIILFGLNLLSLVVTGFLINIFIGWSDVAVDSQMVIAEQKYKLKGKLQTCQWISLGVMGLIVSLLGAKIASIFPDSYNYKIAYAVAAIIPISILVYLFTKYKEDKITSNEKPKFKRKEIFNKLKDKRLSTGLLFIICLNFCPGFGLALTAKLRETMGISKMFLGFLGATGTVLGIIGYVIYYKIAYKFPMKKLLYFMIIFSAITNLFYLYIPNQWVLLIYNVLFGAFGGVALMTILTFFVSIIPKGFEGLFYALVTSVSNFSSKGGDFFGGLLYDRTNYEVTVIVSTVTTLLCLFIIPHLKIEE